MHETEVVGPRPYVKIREIELCKYTKNPEIFLIFYASIFFLSFSLLVYVPLKTLTNLRFGQSLIFASVLALGFVFIFRKKLGRTSGPSDSSTVMSKPKFDFLILILLFCFSFSVLLFRVMQNSSSVITDEPMHLLLTQEIYRALSTSDFGYLAHFVQIYRYPILPYMLTVAVIPHSVFSLFWGRVFTSLLSSFVPVVLYFMARDYGLDRRFSALTAFALVLSPIFENNAFVYTFDGVSTLLFTMAFFFFVKAIEKRKNRFFAISGAFFVLLLPKYPPVAWLVLFYIIMITFLVKRRKWSMRAFLPLIVVVVPFLLLMLMVPAGAPLAIAAMILRASSQAAPFWIGTLWDLIFVFGWSPYLILVIMVWRVVRSAGGRANWDVTVLASLLAIVLAFLTLIVPYGPVSRRVVQVIPIFFATTVSYAYKHYSREITALIILNLSWWGILSLVR